MKLEAYSGIVSNEALRRKHRTIFLLFKTKLRFFISAISSLNRRKFKSRVFWCKLISFIFVLFLFYSCNNINNKPYTFGGEKYDSARDILKSKKGYVLAGMTTSFGIGGIDGLWLHIDKNLKKIKHMTYGGKGDDKFYSIIDKMNGYLLVGSTTSYGAGNNDIYLIGINENGKLNFTKTFGGDLFDEAKSICKTIDNNFIIAGNTISFGTKTDFDIYLIKIDSNGNCIWTRTIGGLGNDIVSKIIHDGQDEYLIIGSSSSKSKGLPDAFLIKIDGLGNKIMEKYYGYENSDNGHNIIKSKNNIAYYIVGNSASNENLIDIYIIKIDSNGNIIWEKKYGGKGLDSANDIIETDNNELILIGTTESKSKGMSDIIAIKINENGLIKWESTYGGIKDEYSSVITKANKNFYLILGWTASFGVGDYDIIMLKIDENGHIL